MLGTSFNPMNEYLFYTIEGHTSPPLETKAVENCQLLGRAKGRNQTEARQYLLDENPWIDEVGFDIQSAIAQQIIAEKQKETLQEILHFFKTNHSSLEKIAKHQGQNLTKFINTLSSLS